MSTVEIETYHADGTVTVTEIEVEALADGLTRHPFPDDEGVG